MNLIKHPRYLAILTDVASKPSYLIPSTSKFKFNSNKHKQHQKFNIGNKIGKISTFVAATALLQYQSSSNNTTESSQQHKQTKNNKNNDNNKFDTHQQTNNENNNNSNNDKNPSWQAGQYINNDHSHLPFFSRNEIRLHNTDTSLWITYNHGVYDITDFLIEHPGSASMIYLAINGNHDIGPFWSYLGFHNQNEVHTMLEIYRIGNINKNDFINTEITPPKLDPELMEQREFLNKYAFSLEPFIAETPIEQLHNNFYTPIEAHYVRNHAPVPIHLTWDDSFTIQGIGVPKQDNIDDDEDEEDEGISIKYSELLNLPFVERDIYLQCGGHRRREYNKYGKVTGSKWNVGAIGNSHYKGVLLYDVFKHYNIDINNFNNNNISDYHVWFIGADSDARGIGYGVSIPLSKALDPNGDVMIAFEQNGKPLTRDHGFPARLLVPGWVGARSVKWIENILIKKEPCNYRSFTGSYRMTADPLYYEMRGLPVNSAIHLPLDNDKINLNNCNNIIHVCGEAHSGDGNGICRVDVSIDGGKTWNCAKLIHPNQSFKKEWSWTKWECDIKIDKNLINNNQLEIVCRAFDTMHNRQPETCQNDIVFNPKGYSANPYHRIKVEVEM